MWCNYIIAIICTVNVFYWILVYNTPKSGFGLPVYYHQTEDKSEIFVESDFINQQNQRKEHFKEMCSKYKDKVKSLNELYRATRTIQYKRFSMMDQFSMLWCHTGKVGTSTLKRVFIELLGIKFRPTKSKYRDCQTFRLTLYKAQIV